MRGPALSSLAPSAAEEGGFQPPTISETHLPEILPWMAEWGTGFGKNMLMAMLSVLLIYLRSRRVRTIARRTRAAEWIGPTPQVEEPPAV